MKRTLCVSEDLNDLKDKLASNSSSCGNENQRQSTAGKVQSRKGSLSLRPLGGSDNSASWGILWLEPRGHHMYRNS